MTKKEKRKLVAKIKDKAKRLFAGTFAMYFLLTTILTYAPMVKSYALTGGPSQPEVQSFEPIGTSDMVDLFSGDFTYNIPLLDVEGYPINLAYHSGVTMDQEASWVGLGWNVNVGTINRALRGLPDDFNGDEVVTEMNMKPNTTIGLTASASDLEIFGKKITLPNGNSQLQGGPSLGVNLGVNYNNYTGVGFDLGFSAKTKFNFLGLGGSGSLGLNSSSSGGLSISPSVSLSKKIKSLKNADQSGLSSSIGASFNSRQGVTSLTIGANLTADKISTKTTRKKSRRADGQGATGVSTSFDMMQPTYTPSITQSMSSFAITARVKGGIEFFGADAGFSLGASYSTQQLKNSEKNKSVSSYGYLYSENGQNNSQARHDFNRENQSSVSASTPNLSLANYTYDIFSVSGQGVGGSYRPFRNQIGHVYDNDATNTSISAPFTLELSVGTAAHTGGEISVATVTSKSGKWKEDSFTFKGDNKADDILNFNAISNEEGAEKVVFREANEMSVATDQAYYYIFGGEQPVKVDLEEHSNWNVEATNKLNFGQSSTAHSIPRAYKTGRVKRNSTIQFLTIEEVRSGMGITEFISGSAAESIAEPHHIGQIISLGTDGMRYVYGQPAYNLKQREVTFAVGQTVGGNSFSGNKIYNEGIIEYTLSDNSINNEWGLDHYYQAVETPPFAHSYLLTAVVSDDYVDVDGIKGPSDGDLGSYTKFSYSEVGGSSHYHWRVPFQENITSYNEGLKSDPTDDKANYIYGIKEMYYLDQIETKNFIAIFTKSNRDDAFGVQGENGVLNQNVALQKLDKISLYSKEDIRKSGSISLATPLKEVHFEYDYELCQNIPNNQTGGKLTLKKVYFTYRDSNKGKLSPYEFAYQNNYSYNLKAYDRWGCYKPNTAMTGEYSENALATFEYPYVEQNDPNVHDYVAAWTLSRIDLPSGGTIVPTFESDDYAFVQHKRAMEMHKIISVGNDNNQYQTSSTGSVLPVSDDNNKNRRLFFEKDPLVSTQKYVEGIENLYFKCLMEFDDGVRYDYVPGYAQIKTYGEDPNNSSIGYIELEPVSFNDNSSAAEYNPIALSGIQFGRLHLSRYVWDSPAFNENQTFTGQVINSLWQTLANFVEGFKNPNQEIYDNDRGTRIVINKSWIRLNDVDGKKLGGGCRVKKIEINDNWSDMTGGASTPSFEYGQEYDYRSTSTINGVQISSGVASYEPQLGGDENPFKQPIYYDEAKKFAPDDRYFQEEPLGESFFPSASVGYSRVEVKNLQYNNVKKNAAGSVVHEFYTAKDFPTITQRTPLENIEKKSSPFGLTSLLKLKTQNYYTGSQGFVVITNDMHGKPKSQMVFQEDQEDPITKVEYEYQTTQGPFSGTNGLNNTVKVINKNGIVSSEQIGVNFDLVADFQHSQTRTSNIGLSLNLDVIPLVFFPLFIPTVWPNYNTSKTQFNSATMTKVVQKFGILKNTKATDLGSVVETKNLAYDAETGQPILTETTTDFNDHVYTLSYPAYWYYDNMGPAYKNIGYNKTLTINAGIFNTYSGHLFVEGDELSLTSNGSSTKAWVSTIDNSSGTIRVILADGSAPANGTYDVKVIRSGRRNMQSQMMASITTRTNPINSISTNLYNNVLQASAIEFTDEWRTYCDCNGNVATASTNPYFLGTKGNYKPKVSYLHLSDRTQSDRNNNTDIRDDGMFKSYTPYYRLNSNGKWEVNRKDWTYTAEVTEFNPFGQELENQDALGRYSAAEFGYNQTLAKAVAANARYREIGFSSFEDDNFSECADNHFKFQEYGILRTDVTSHTGKYSVKVNSTASAKIKKDLVWCDQSDCSIDLQVTNNGSGHLLVDVLNGTENAVISYSIVSGDPIVIPTENGPQVLLQDSYEIEFTVVDENGCQDIQLIKVVNGQIQ